MTSKENRGPRYISGSYNRPVTEELIKDRGIPVTPDVLKDATGKITHIRGSYGGFYPVDGDGKLIYDSNAPKPCYNQD